MAYRSRTVQVEVEEHVVVCDDCGGEIGTATVLDIREEAIWVRFNNTPDRYVICASCYDRLIAKWSKTQAAINEGVA